MPLHFDAALPYHIGAFLRQISLWRRPVRENLIGVVVKVIEGAEVALDRDFHLIADVYLVLIKHALLVSDLNKMLMVCFEPHLVQCGLLLLLSQHFLLLLAYLCLT